MEEMWKMNSPKWKCERIGSFLSGVIILLLRIFGGTAKIICKYPPHGASTGWHIISRETGVAFFWGGLSVVKSKDGSAIKKVHCEALRDNRSTLNRMPAQLGIGWRGLLWRQERLATRIKPGEIRQTVWKSKQWKMKTKGYANEEKDK